MKVVWLLHSLFYSRDYGLPESTKSHVQISMKYSVILILLRGDQNLLRLSVSNIIQNLFSVTTNQTNVWYKHQTLPLQDFFFFLILGCTKSDCRGPSWGIPPVTRSCGRKPDKTQRCDQASGVPPGISWASTHQDQSLPALLCYAFHLLFCH